jgi:hypothetical protein
VDLEWVRTYQRGDDYAESAGGITWDDAGVPPRWHICYPQTRARIRGHYAERCPCGAIRDSTRGPWAQRNWTRRERRRRKREAKMPKVNVACTGCGQPYEAVARSAIARERQCNRCRADPNACWPRLGR